MPQLERETVPLVYVVSEFAIPEIPVCAPPTFGPEMVTAFPFWETVMLLPPARVSVPEEMSACAPEVFPESVTATMFWVCTVWADRSGHRDVDPLPGVGARR